MHLSLCQVSVVHKLLLTRNRDRAMDGREVKRAEGFALVAAKWKNRMEKKKKQLFSHVSLPSWVLWCNSMTEC